MFKDMASLPTQPHIVLIADSRLGFLFRVDITTGISKIAFKDDTLSAPTNTSIPIGIKGLKICRGYVDFTNTARGTFSRIPVSADGLNFGDVELIATLDTSDSGDDWDDFALDPHGVAAIHPLSFITLASIEFMDYFDLGAITIKKIVDIMSVIHGHCEPAFQKVRDLLEQNILAEQELGVSLCANINGQDVVNLWGGYADRARSKPWKEDTISVVWSTSKCITNLAALT
ncbi:hypothetical protein PoHVEF18_009382 [Penicillium ochrochloron]